MRRGRGIVSLCTLVALSVACDSGTTKPPAVVASADSVATDSWCRSIPRAANAAFPRAAVRSDWFDVYVVDTNVYAIVEPKQWQEAISYLIVGRTGALLWDSGIGLMPLRPIVAQLTTLPVRVLNSHTHFDHVGGNAEFDAVLAMDTPFTRQNEQGKPHAGLASEVAPASFCGGPPAEADTAGFHSRKWRVTRRVADGDTIDLGGRVLEVLSTPGHTPDAAMLLDRVHGLLFTGDSYYASTLWLFMPETDLAAYQRSMDRAANLAPLLRRLLPAHNTISESPARLAAVAHAVRTMRDGGGARTALEGTQLRVTVGDVVFLTSAALIAAPSDAGGARRPAP